MSYYHLRYTRSFDWVSVMSVFAKANQSWFSFLKELWPHIELRRRQQLGFVFVLMVVASFSEMLTIGALVPFLGVLLAPEKLLENEVVRFVCNALSLSASGELLFPITAVFVFFVLFAGVVRVLLLWLQIRISYAIGADLSLSIYRLTLYQPYAVHLGRNSSELIASISNKADVIVNNAILPMMVLASSGLIALVIISTLIALAPAVAILSFLGFGLIYGLVAFFTKSILQENGKIVNRESVLVIKALQEGLGGIRDVLIDGAQEVYCDVYKQADNPLRRAKANIQVIANSPRFVIEALGMVLVAILAYGLSRRAEGLSNAIPLLGALALGAQRLLPILQQSFQTWSGVTGSQVTLSEALGLLTQPKPDHADKPNGSLLPFKHAIHLNGMSFSYTGADRYALCDLNLIIPKGGRIGFIGTTGSGKSTLLDIVMGLLTPTSGSLLVDGVSVTEANHREWQKHIAHVPQAIFLADSTIAENIAFGVPRDQIDESRVIHAAELAQLAETIEKLPQGLKTVVGERGIRLSGGQRQRIGIARALYKQADVIVFDEATSALDNETESAVMDAIEGLSKDLTILMVAHRVTTLKKCVSVVELAHGQIERVGSYAEIIG
ncbi:ATP-binding cassette subfamily B protein [Jezberella montanilacus]|uniref:ATP-binding cassette subfamily B protein n=2 Tax=Jezberella montanilacus TaxID=323426 RepID=A0A2T0XI72_9BURK|nr:ATP-binding cassette subfamily B protein [Jezberella montanilacus]